MIKQIYERKDVHGTLEYNLCVLRFAPNELTAKYQIIFQEDLDDLDYYKFAVIETPSGNQFALQCYPRSPVGGTAVITNTNRDKAESVLNDLLNTLGLSREDLTWIRDWSDE